MIDSCGKVRYSAQYATLLRPRNAAYRVGNQSVNAGQDQDGFDENLQRAVRENCKVLGFVNAEFEK